MDAEAEEEPLLDDCGDFPDAEMTDTAVKSPSLIHP